MEKKIREEHQTKNLDTARMKEIRRIARLNVPYLVVLAGESVGRVIRLDPHKDLTIGRTRGCQLFFDCENISREHAIFEMGDEGQTLIRDLGSTNGTLVNGKKVDRAVLQDGDRICLGNVILRYSFKDDLEFGLHQDLYEKATRDPLTGVFNKRYFMETLYKEFAFHRRQKMPLSLVMMDLDDFKRLNDTYGHVNGDIVLKSLAREVKSCMRREDMIARFGGEEFVMLFCGTPRETAIIIADKLLELVRAMKFGTATVVFSTSATLGVACLENDNFSSADEMLMAADQNLYIGKEEGKNRVVG